jgi:Aspartyl protease
VKATSAAALLACALLAGCGGGGTTAVPKGSLVVTIKVLKHGRQVLAVVPVTIDGKGPYSFALDTGASQSLVDSSLAKKLGAPRTGSKQRIAGVTSVSSAPSIEVRSWRVGSVKLPPTTIVAADLPFGNVVGLLGSDMLSLFDVVTIDYGHSRLVLHHRAATRSSD